MISVKCPRCNEGTIEVDITHYYAGRSGSYYHPPEGPEVEWSPTEGGACENCNADGSIFEVEAQMDLMIQRVLECQAEYDDYGPDHDDYERNPLPSAEEQARIQRELKR